MINLTIPIKLVSEANSSEHWTKKSKRHKIQKMLVRSYLMTKILPDLPCHVTLTRCAPRPYDEDNLQTSFKFIRDQISESLTKTTLAGRADSDPRITWAYSQEKTNAKENYIKIKIEPCLSSNAPSADDPSKLALSKDGMPSVPDANGS